ncbi:MAG TPA: energy transducer TonB [Pyrinomonadaceae bacterium]|nr:energy transducer TonB [Pyrinomonadaceae bacterium]
MFTNLIESQSHVREFKRRSSFFLITVVGYAIALTGAGVASVFAYDAQLEAQTSSLELLNWVPPVTPDRPLERIQSTRRAPATNSSSRNVSQPVRPVLYESASSPTKPPDTVSSAPNPIPPAPPHTRIGNYIADPVQPVAGSSTCVTCNSQGGEPRVRITDDVTPPTPPPVKPPTIQRVPSVVLNSKVVSLPQPLYPMIAKQAGVQGTVNIQILVDEMGRVVSAQIVSGNTLLNAAAREAAMRARFTPTTLNGVPVKIQGVITYNFRLQ